MTRPAKVYRPAFEISAWCGRLVPVLPAFIALNISIDNSSNSRFLAAASVLSVSSFSGPPFTSEGGTKSGVSFGSAVSLQCTAPAGAWFAGPAVRDDAALGIPFLDTTQIHVRAALDTMLS